MPRNTNRLLHARYLVPGKKAPHRTVPDIYFSTSARTAWHDSSKPTIRGMASADSPLANASRHEGARKRKILLFWTSIHQKAPEVEMHTPVSSEAFASLVVGIGPFECNVHDQRQLLVRQRIPDFSSGCYFCKERTCKKVSDAWTCLHSLSWEPRGDSPTGGH
jgi:hypothetical protein